MTENPSASSTPDFPALLIEDGGSVGTLDDIVYWTGDVDMWFWSSADAFIVDSRGIRFDQLAERDNSGRPKSIPEWVFHRKLTGDELSRLTLRDFPDVSGEF
ncbi:hypothetical protein N9891_01580 [bacterium]|nr:hypothetical protein [bacterium]